MSTPHPIRLARLGMARLTGRWTPQRKADLLLLVDEGAIRLADLQRDYGVTIDELEAWRDRVRRLGKRGLRQLYQPNRSTL